ncbi:MAG TPA: methionyl-tRNA formyltransferase [Solirubrobacteraceae bacterium]|nr:methionyl-tRNA formyltransferase [Solirubrobacteraceae bacterium]
MRTVYLGTSEFAAQVLGTLAASPHRPALVVTRPDRPRGRGRRLAAPPVADAARELGIDLDQPESVNDEAARQRIAAAAPDAVIVCAFGALIREPLLSEHPILNVHPSLLPRWRGAAPIERAIMAGDECTGVAIMCLTEGLDSGPVCLTGDEPIAPDDTYGTLAPRLAALGGRLLVQALDTSPPFQAQDEAAVTYADKITVEDRILAPGRPADELARVVRALAPHIGAAVIEPDGERLGIWEATARPAAAGDPAPGELRLDAGPVPVLGCSPGTLALDVVQPGGRRAMPGADFLRGRRG